MFPGSPAAAPASSGRHLGLPVPGRPGPAGPGLGLVTRTPSMPGNHLVLRVGIGPSLTVLVLSRRVTVTRTVCRRLEMNFRPATSHSLTEESLEVRSSRPGLGPRGRLPMTGRRKNELTLLSNC
jgi:hypothetical protein